MNPAERIAWTVASITPLNATAMEAARDRQARLTKPPRSLGRVEDVAVWLAGVRGEPVPRLRSPIVVVATADHGVARQGVSAYPQAVTAQMMRNFLSGGAAISVLARRAGARLVLVDAGIANPLPDTSGWIDARGGPGTSDMTAGPAMSRRQAERMVASGIDLMTGEAERGADVLLPGEMGIANTTAAAALTAALLDLPPEAVVGPGTGLDAAAVSHKAEVVRRALEVNAIRPDDPLDALARVGGLEIAFLAGAVLGAAAHRVPVVLDGFITCAAALVAAGLAPIAREFFLASHRSAEPGHAHQLRALGLEPLVDLNLRLGEGSGAALVLPLILAALDLHAEMATFDEAGVSGPMDS